MGTYWTPGTCDSMYPSLATKISILDGSILVSLCAFITQYGIVLCIGMAMGGSALCYFVGIFLYTLERGSSLLL